MIKQKGFGLPEVMISLLLAGLVNIALLNHFISIKQQHSHLQSTMDDAMELQLAADLIRDSIRQAGFTPCMSLNQLITVDQRDAHEGLSGIETGNELIIQRMGSEFNVMQDRLDSTRIVLTNDSIIRTDRPIIIADCFHAEVQNVLDVHHSAEGQVVTLANPLAFTYQQPAYAGEWLHERFFIRALRGLFYQRHHTDQLSPLVKTWSLQENEHLVLVRLGLDKHQFLMIDARVRAW